MKNLRVNFKKIGALVFSGVLTLACCGCDEEPIDIVLNTGNGIVSTDETDATETTFIEDTSVLEENGTTVYYVTDELGETSFLDTTEVTVSDVVDDTDSKTTTSKTTYTTTIGSDISDSTSIKDETTVRNDDTTIRHDTTTTKNNDTTTRETTTQPRNTTTTRDTTTKSTTTTKETTVTTTTTTTTKQSGDSLAEMKTDWKALRYYHSCLCTDITTGQLILIQMPYGKTSCGDECYFTLIAMNYGYISDDVIKFIFSNFSESDVENFKEFLYSFSSVQSTYKTSIDFSKYTIDSDIGNYMNKIQDAYFNGTFDSFMTDQIVNGNIKDKYLNNPAIMSYMLSCDKSHKYLNKSDIDQNYMDSFLNHIFGLAYGHSYTKK